MTWRAIHPSLTEDRRVPTDHEDAPTFTLGFWPPLEAEKAKIYVSKVRRIGEATDAEELSRRASVDLDAFWAMARFGVRGWKGLGDIECATERVVIDGREHVALTDDSMRVLYHNGLLLPVALECWKFNSLTEEEKKASSSPSKSSTSTSGTPVAGATTSSALERNGAASSASMAGQSMAARTN